MSFDGDAPPTQYKLRNGKLVSNGSATQSMQRWQRSSKRHRKEKVSLKRRNIAVLDLETDPFDNENKTPVFPFLAVVYSDQFPTIIIWENDWKTLISKLIVELEALSEPFTIYAHNGGRFDYMFLMHHLDGRTKFKGRALMSAKIGQHELRDSLHIIPESLKNANRKTDIDYRYMHRSQREQRRKTITDYCIEDCIATFEVVRSFIDRFGMPITIGQASMTELKKHYTFARLSEPVDRYMRQWFYGGRVECLAPPGRYRGEYKLFDVNSMYPGVMANVEHPISDEFVVNDHVTTKTAFIQLECDNRGAFISRSKDGTLTTRQKRGVFFTTIHEYRMARELGLIDNWSIIKTIDFFTWTDFSKFVLPLYSKRDELKMVLERTPNHSDRKSIEQEIKFLKYLLNNAYGKFAQNPRRFKEYWITPLGERPPDKWLFNGVDIEAKRNLDEDTGSFAELQENYHAKRHFPQEEVEYEYGSYAVWGIPSIEWRFNNVATAASITGAARAKLMRARHFADGALYCDTDSLVCRDLRDHEIDASKLGTWKCETLIDDFIMAGKKLYGYRTPFGKEVIRAKGNQGVTWADLEDTIAGRVVRKTLKAPTIGRDQRQHYMTREIRMTAETEAD